MKHCGVTRVSVEPPGTYFISWRLYCYRNVSSVTHGGCTVTLVTLQNLMVAPTVTLVRPTGDTIVTQGYPSVTTVSQCGSIVTILPMLPVGLPGDTVETLGYLSITTVSHCDSTVDSVSLPYLMVAPLLHLCLYSISCGPNCYHSVTTVSPGGRLLSINTVSQMAHCYPRVTTVAYGDPLVLYCYYSIS